MTQPKTLQVATKSFAVAMLLIVCACGGQDDPNDNASDESAGAPGSDVSATGGGAGAGISAMGGRAAGGSATGGSATGGVATGGSATGGNGGGNAAGASGTSTTGVAGVKSDGGGSEGSAPDGSSGAVAPVGISGAWTLSFSDEFNGAAIDTAKWRVMGTGDPVNWGSQSWRTDDSFLDGNGHLVTRLTTASGPVTGGAIYSKWKLSKGYYEARIKHEGGWFAWWIESPRMGDGGATEDPAVYGTEMDICEAMAWTGNVLAKQHAVHWHGYAQYHQTVSASTGISDTDWHVYGFKWSDTGYDFYVDGKPTWHFTTAISQTLDQDMIINNASYQGQQTSGMGYVDYVRYWTPG